MTEPDPFRYDDGAYVLGALSPDEQNAFEEHLLTCDECVARVREIRGLPRLLDDVAEGEVAAEPVPETLLPRLLREATRRQRRRRIVIGTLAAVAAACVVALVVALWPSTSSTPAQRQFTAVAQTPVQATAALRRTSWGTAIDVRCHYLHYTGDIAYRYDLVVYDRSGRAHSLGDWRLPPDRDIDYWAGTSLSPQQIARLEITLPDGTPVLQLRT